MKFEPENMFAEILVQVSSSESISRPRVTVGFKNGDQLQMNYEEWTALVSEVEEALEKINSKAAVRVG